MLLRALQDTFRLHCCSERFKQLYSRISNGLTSCGFSCRSDLVPGMCVYNDLSVRRAGDHRQL